MKTTRTIGDALKTNERQIFFCNVIARTFNSDWSAATQYQLISMELVAMTIRSILRRLKTIWLYSCVKRTLNGAQANAYQCEKRRRRKRKKKLCSGIDVAVALCVKRLLWLLALSSFYPMLRIYLDGCFEFQFWRATLCFLCTNQHRHLLSY